MTPQAKELAVMVMTGALTNADESMSINTASYASNLCCQRRTKTSSTSKKDNDSHDDKISKPQALNLNRTSSSFRIWIGNLPEDATWKEPFFECREFAVNHVPVRAQELGFAVGNVGYQGFRRQRIGSSCLTLGRSVAVWGIGGCRNLAL